MLWKTEGFVVWLTGLPGSGKSTIANALCQEFTKNSLRVELLDGDEIRKKVSPEVSFSREDRELHAKRIAYISKLLSRNGIATIVSLISPFRSSRDYARSIIPRFIEVWVNCSLENCKQRDPKELYKRAATGEIKNLTGVQDPYEPPINPEIILNTDNEQPDICKSKIVQHLINKSYIQIGEKGPSEKSRFSNHTTL